MQASFRSFLQPGRQRRRLLMTIFGVIICGMSVSLFKQAAFGVDPFQSFCNGVHQIIPMSFGTLYMCINIVMLAIALLFYRQYVGVATFINLFLLGYVIDFSEQALFALMGPPSMAMRVVYLILGVLIMCFSGSMYMTANLGVSTYDAVALFLTEKKLGPFRIVRICTDLTCVVIGWVLGFAPGVGTVVSALCMGPIIAFFNTRFSIPLMEGKWVRKKTADA